MRFTQSKNWDQEAIGKEKMDRAFKIRSMRKYWCGKISVIDTCPLTDAENDQGKRSSPKREVAPGSSLDIRSRRLNASNPWKGLRTQGNGRRVLGEGSAGHKGTIATHREGAAGHKEKLLITIIVFITIVCNTIEPVWCLILFTFHEDIATCEFTPNWTHGSLSDSTPVSAVGKQRDKIKNMSEHNLQQIDKNVLINITTIASQPADKLTTFQNLDWVWKKHEDRRYLLHTAAHTAAEKITELGLTREKPEATEEKITELGRLALNLIYHWGLHNKSWSINNIANCSITMKIRR